MVNEMFAPIRERVKSHCFRKVRQTLAAAVPTTGD
jgi:hypothetical protein